MKKSRKTISQDKVKSLIANLSLCVDIIFGEPTKKMQTIKVKSKYKR